MTNARAFGLIAFKSSAKTIIYRDNRKIRSMPTHESHKFQYLTKLALLCRHEAHNLCINVDPT